jgi:hypothetical protein
MDTDFKTNELVRLMNGIIELATSDPKAPIREMPPIEIITSALSITIDDQGELEPSETILGALAGCLAWIAFHHWADVSKAIRKAEGMKIH